MSPPSNVRWCLWIMLAVLVWGAFHAVGAFFMNGHPMRLVVVLGAVEAFLLFWLAMLVWRSGWRPRSTLPSLLAMTAGAAVVTALATPLVRTAAAFHSVGMTIAVFATVCLAIVLAVWLLEQAVLNDS